MINYLPETVLQTVPSIDRSKKFGMIETMPIVQEFLNKGFQITRLTVQKTRKQEWLGHEKHMITLSRGEHGEVGTPNVNLINASNGSTLLWLIAGYNVKACSNGLIVSNEFSSIKVRHTVNSVKDFNLTLDKVLEAFELNQVLINRMMQKTLSVYDQWKFAEFGTLLRWKENEVNFPVSRLLQGYRLEQKDSTIWNIFNRIQENLIRGFKHFGRYRRDNVKVRPVKGLQSDLTINKKLWEYAEKLLLG